MIDLRSLSCCALGTLVALSAPRWAQSAPGGAKSQTDAKQLKDILKADGWIPVGDLDGRFKLGAVLIKTQAGRYEMYAGPGECFDASSAQRNALGSQHFSNQLKAGVSVPGWYWGAKTDGEITGRISFDDPVHEAMSTYALSAGEDCVNQIRQDTERGFTSFSTAFVVSETLSASMSSDSCNSLEASATAIGARASTAFESCRSFSTQAGGLIIGYKPRFLWQVRVLQDIIRAPSVSVDSNGPSTQRSSSGPTPPPARRGVPSGNSGETRQRRTQRRQVAPPPATAGQVLDQWGHLLEKIPATTFWMGSTKDEFRVFSNADRYDEYRHKVAITRPYMIGKTEVTQNLYQAIMGLNPSDPRYVGDFLPVINVSWANAVRFCNRLSAAEGFEPAYQFDGELIEWQRDSNGYRLLTEAEWENAARSGTATTYAGSNQVELVAWIAGPGTDGPSIVATKKPNRGQLYDMSGNAFEWVWDAYESYPRRGLTTDPVGGSGYMGRVGGDCGASSWDHRVGRGGSWRWGLTGDHTYGLGLTRVSGRAYNTFCWQANDMGFRIGRTVAD